MTNTYQIIEVSWEEKWLKGKSYPQSVKIITPGFLGQLKELLYTDSEDALYRYYREIPNLLNRYSDPLMGKLDYKEPLDFMGIYYFRPGMIACVSEKVKCILEKLEINQSDYILKPIKLIGVVEMFYVLFIPMIPLEQAGIDFHKSVYLYNFNEATDSRPIVQCAQDYLRDQDNLKPHILSLTTTDPKDIYHIESCSHIFYSHRIVNMFITEGITGARVVPVGQLCSLSVNN